MAIDQALVTLVKPYVSGRMYPLTLPENPDYPCITYRQLSHLMDPIVNVGYPTFQLDLWTETYSENVELRDSIVSGLDRQKSITNGYPIRFHYLTYINMYDSTVRKMHGIMDIEIRYKEV